MIFFLSIIIFSVSPGLYAFGKKQIESETEPVNTEYVFCITSLDTSALPPARQAIGDTVVKILANSFNNLDFRFRGEAEAAFYREQDWARSRAAAARLLQTRRNERDLLLYRGDPAWKYRKSLKAVNEQIQKLEEELASIDASTPNVEKKPEIRLTDGNINGIYPMAPDPGGEYLFCIGQNSDAFLTGSLSEYHQRLYLELSIYTLHTGSYSYVDSVLFSSDDFSEAMDEVAIRLAVAVSDILPAGILVQVTPQDAIASIDGSFAASGEYITHSPGDVEIAVRADNYVPLVFPLTLNPGELAELFINLTPLGYSSFEVAVPDYPGSLVYRGGLFIGETPLALRIPGTEFSYISVETRQGEIGSVVFYGDEIVKGRASLIRSGESQAGRSAIFSTNVPVSPEEKRVERARRGFYGSYGAFWFILPASLLTAGIAGNYILANNYAVTQRTYEDDMEMFNRLYSSAITAQKVQRAAYGILGVSLGVTFFQIFRYLYVSGADATPIVKDTGTGTEQ